MKKLLSILFAACMFFMLLPTNANALANAAKIGDTEYASLSEASDNAKDGDTVTMLADYAYPENGVGLLNITNPSRLTATEKLFQGMAREVAIKPRWL